MNQHGINGSFRAAPVSELLHSLHLPEVSKPTFMRADFWKGLLIYSCPDPKRLDLAISSSLETWGCDLDIAVTTNESNSVSDDRMIIDSTLPFESYLSAALAEAERRSGVIYDYIVFLDGHYDHLGIEFIRLNVESLFSEWIDVSTVAREIKGRAYAVESGVHRVNPNDRTSGRLIETLLGQGGAIRTSVIRRGNLDCSEVHISSIVERKLSVKRSDNDC